MCDDSGIDATGTLLQAPVPAPATATIEQLLPYAREICNQEEVRRTAPGFIGYGATKEGDRVLIAVDTHYDRRVVDTVAHSLRERGARVDVMWVEAEPDRDFRDG